MMRGSPIQEGGQLKEIQKYLIIGDANHEIEYVWYDYWCMPQKNSTGKEQKSDKDYDERTEEQKKDAFITCSLMQTSFILAARF